METGMREHRFTNAADARIDGWASPFVCACGHRARGTGAAMEHLDRVYGAPSAAVMRGR